LAKIIGGHTTHLYRHPLGRSHFARLRFNEYCLCTEYLVSRAQHHAYCLHCSCCLVSNAPCRWGRQCPGNAPSVPVAWRYPCDVMDWTASVVHGPRTQAVRYNARTLLYPSMLHTA
jgi:hypothetical protein